LLPTIIKTAYTVARSEEELRIERAIETDTTEFGRILRSASGLTVENVVGLYKAHYNSIEGGSNAVTETTATVASTNTAATVASTNTAATEESSDADGQSDSDRKEFIFAADTAFANGVVGVGDFVTSRGDGCAAGDSGAGDTLQRIDTSATKTNLSPIDAGGSPSIQVALDAARTHDSVSSTGDAEVAAAAAANAAAVSDNAVGASASTVTDAAAATGFARDPGAGGTLQQRDINATKTKWSVVFSIDSPSTFENTLTTNLKSFRTVVEAKEIHEYELDPLLIIAVVGCDDVTSVYD
jgi:hypothetical protein